MEVKEVVGVEIATNATNKTPNYGLPIFIGTDKPSWLVDWNGSMTEIDRLLKEIDTKETATENDVELLKVQMETAGKAIEDAQTELATITENVGDNSSDINNLKESVNIVQDDLIKQNALIKELSTTVSTLRTLVGNHGVSIQALETSVENLETATTAAETEIRKLTNELGGVESRVTQVELLSIEHESIFRTVGSTSWTETIQMPTETPNRVLIFISTPGTSTMSRPTTVINWDLTDTHQKFVNMSSITPGGTPTEYEPYGVTVKREMGNMIITWSSPFAVSTLDFVVLFL